MDVEAFALQDRLNSTVERMNAMVKANMELETAKYSFQSVKWSNGFHQKEDRDSHQINGCKMKNTLKK
jgi:hypothetical protein